MGDAVISFAIEKLGEFLVHQVNIRIGVRDDISWLREELGFLQASVERAESRQEDEVIRLWISTVRDAANEAVDILNRFHDGQASPQQGHMNRFLPCFCFCKKEAELYDIGNNIESVKKKIGVIKERRREYSIDNILAAGPRETVTEKVIKSKRRGLPLAIVILGGLLLHNKSYDYWSKVKDHIWRNLRDDSVDIVEILSLSYKDLSPHLKDCFLYLARFPEDHIMDAEHLKQLWIAEDFISEDERGDGVLVEDLAEDCLNELITRNMIQIESLLLNEKVRDCRVHDLVRELAIKKAEEHKFLVVLDAIKRQPNHIHLLEGQRRHAIYDEIGDYLKLLKQHRFDASSLRSLLLNGYHVQVELLEMKSMYTRFKNLKVLDMSSVQSERIPEEIGELVLLKFLGLMGCADKTIAMPPSIGKLKKLRSLWGGPDGSSYTVPREIWELPELRHLYYVFIKISERLNVGSHHTQIHSFYGIDFEEWLKIDTVNFTNLRTLYIETNGGRGGYSLESTANLTNLQTFRLWMRPGVVIPTLESLSSLNRLKSVYLVGDIQDGSELRFLPNSVTDLSISSSGLKEDPMAILGSLPNLTALKLDIGVYGGNKMVCSKNAFSSLQILRLRNFFNLKELLVEDGALPCLNSFEAVSCRQLKKISTQLERFLT